MAAPFHDADASPYQAGNLFLGYSDTGREIGIGGERHFLTVAGSGAGKGSALVIPNLLRWQQNALVIDPGGGNARATWQAREAMGQTVHIIDAARVSLDPDRNHPGVPARLLKTFNPLAQLDPKSRTYGEDLDVIADGLVMRHDPRHARWDNASAKMIAGVIDFLFAAMPPEHRTLPEVRRLLIQTPDALKGMFQAMTRPDMPDAARAAGTSGLTDIADESAFVENAQANTAWLSYTSIAETFATSTCDLRDLKTKPCTVFLVIDPDYLEQHGRLLRLFVRMALSIMARGGDAGRECLFILDEFFALGRIDYLQKAAGLMRKNGVHLWPILQSFRQLPQLYGDNGADPFLTNADALIFFGLDQDKAACDYVSARLGRLTPSEIAAAPPEAETFDKWKKRLKPWDRLAQDEQSLRDQHRVEHENARAAHSHSMAENGHPRLAPEAVAALTGKQPGQKVAASMIVFGAGGSAFNLRPAPYFQPPPSPPGATLPPVTRPVSTPWPSGMKYVVAAWALLTVLMAAIFKAVHTLSPPGRVSNGVFVAFEPVPFTDILVGSAGLSVMGIVFVMWLKHQTTSAH